MARIAYSCCGEGRGHSSRTLLLATRLQELGHEVRLYASNAAFPVLRSKFSSVKEIPGLVLEYRNNRVEVARSVRTNYRIWRGRATAVGQLKDELCAYRPHLIITDFEPFLPEAARATGFPFISVDHQHVIPGLRLNPPIKFWSAYLAALAVVRWTHSGEIANLVTSFFQPLRASRPQYHYFAPVLRDEIALAKPSRQPHVLVYQTSTSFARLPDLLTGLPIEFRIYAFPREDRFENCTFKPRNHPDFIQDLAHCSWVLTNGGYTLMSEALALGKPVLSVPVHGQFEQWINSHHLQKLGYGQMCENKELTRERIIAFQAAQESHRANITVKKFNGNEQILKKILSFL